MIITFMTLVVCYTGIHHSFVENLGKKPAGWLLISYHSAKSIRCQFEHMSYIDRSQLCRPSLHRQIVRCYAIINRDTAEYYRTVINVNIRDLKKLWQVLPQVFGSGYMIILPPHQPENSWANQFAYLFNEKSKGYIHLTQQLYFQRVHLSIPLILITLQRTRHLRSSKIPKPNHVF